MYCQQWQNEGVLCSSATSPGLLFTRVHKTGMDGLRGMQSAFQVKDSLTNKFCSVVGLFFGRNQF